MNQETKLDLIYCALVGSELTKDGGLIKDVQDMKKEFKIFRDRAIKSAVYVKVLWLCAGVAGTGIFTIIVEHLSKK